jgi:hypothetical protein
MVGVGTDFDLVVILKSLELDGVPVLLELYNFAPEQNGILLPVLLLYFGVDVVVLHAFH